MDRHALSTHYGRRTHTNNWESREKVESVTRARMFLCCRVVCDILGSCGNGSHGIFPPACNSTASPVICTRSTTSACGHVPTSTANEHRGVDEFAISQSSDSESSPRRARTSRLARPAARAGRAAAGVDLVASVCTTGGRTTEESLWRKREDPQDGRCQEKRPLG